MKFTSAFVYFVTFMKPWTTYLDISETKRNSAIISTQNSPPAFNYLTALHASAARRFQLIVQFTLNIRSMYRKKFTLILLQLGLLSVAALRYSTYLFLLLGLSQPAY